MDKIAIICLIVFVVFFCIFAVIATIAVIKTYINHQNWLNAFEDEKKRIKDKISECDREDC